MALPIDSDDFPYQAIHFTDAFWYQMITYCTYDVFSDEKKNYAGEP